MLPHSSVSTREFLWFSQYEPILMAAMFLALASIICWILQCFLLLRDCSDGHRQLRRRSSDRSEASEYTSVSGDMTSGACKGEGAKDAKPYNRTSVPARLVSKVAARESLKNI